MSVHVDFAKIIQGKLGLFKTVPITFIAAISSFSILGHEKFTKVICIVYSFDLVKCGCPTEYCYCFVVYFYVI